MSTRPLRTAADLQSFLARRIPVCEGTATWGEGSIQLKSTLYFTADLPPLDYVTSVRGIIFRGHSVLVFRNRWRTHLLPGGRREPGETVHETLVRELLEECG